MVQELFLAANRTVPLCLTSPSSHSNDCLHSEAFFLPPIYHFFFFFLASIPPVFQQHQYFIRRISPKFTKRIPPTFFWRFFFSQGLVGAISRPSSCLSACISHGWMAWFEGKHVRPIQRFRVWWWKRENPLMGACVYLPPPPPRISQMLLLPSYGMGYE
ncbi:hypothetical protein BDV95DRAFT_66695 [Massariosphaeria phaeospora]|uniref:Uncharacterized protein n=1 Tax=Massariosphaeria phaeospora TaxID=100035 RepID=A0A7C8M927_9PLEO|nr:hypothetical protein BDV95DRAFT_66695 [Massariosphaeria phaeospora]